MKRLDRTLELGCSVSEFWSRFFDDEAFATRLYTEGLGFVSAEVVRKTADERVMRLVPNVKLPDALASLLKGTLGYEDRATLDRETSALSFRSAALAEKLVTTGVIRVEPAGEGRCRRRDEVRIEGKVFGLGGLLEQTAEKELLQSWAREERFLKSAFGG